MADELPDLGFSAGVVAQAARHEGLVLGRVVAQYKGPARVVTENSDVCEVLENLKVTRMHSSHGGRKNARAFLKSRENRDQ